MILDNGFSPGIGVISVSSDLRAVTFSRKVGTISYGVPLTLEADRFLELELKGVNRSLWAERLAWWTPKDEQWRKKRELEISIPVTFPKAVGDIIGQGSSLGISGTRTISISGRSDWTEGEVQSAYSRPSKFPSLSMKQESRFTIEGTIGRKIHVQVDQDSRRLGDLENSIVLRYDGDDDEIVQEIEAGNTALSLPQTRFVGFSGQHKGLFGIRSKFKLGGLDITAIASQEKGSSSTKTFRGTAEENTRKIRDYQYKRSTYFFLDERYRKKFEESSYPEVNYDPADSIVSIEVYLDDANPYNNDELRAMPGWAFADPNDPDSTTSGAYERGNFHRLDPETDYFVDNALGYIVIDAMLSDNYILAVAYRTASGEVFGDDSYDPSDPNDEVKLKLIKPRNPRPGYPTWNLEWKNVYDLGTRRINPDGFELKIFKELPGSNPIEEENGVSYLQMLGLDEDRDGKVDFEFVDLERGELIFPVLKPFTSSSLSDTVGVIYSSNDERAKREASKYYIEVTYRNRQARIRLGTFNILKGTEVVTLDGKRLTRNKDYTINYDLGEIKLLTDEALDPNADLTIRYDYAPLFMMQQKTLFGLRGEYKFWERSSIGTSILYSGERAIERRVQLGGEPSRTMLWDLNANLRFEPRVLTAAIDYLPFIETDEPSKIEISAEVAQSIPNPNTRGVAYVDDFEGVKEYIDLGMQRVVWTRSSAPAELGGTEEKRGRIIWYNPFDRVPVKEIWENKETTPEESGIYIFTLEFTPEPEFPEGNGTPPQDLWGGIMRSLGAGGRDISRMKFIEIWARGDRGTLNIDLGSISEDAWVRGSAPNGRSSKGNLNTEDINMNNILDEGEDVGLDGLPDEEEPGYDPERNPDPDHDNWNYDNVYDYSRINGTEGNKFDGARGPVPDTEDINRNGFLDTRNDYYHYSISFDFNEYVVPGTEHNGWKLIRVPLWSDRTAKVGNPDPTKVEYVRIWITGVSEKVRLDIASMDIVGNKWLESEVVATDPMYPITGEEKFDVTVKNTQENRDYLPPPGVKADIDPITRIREKEQSLVLKFERLGPGHIISAYRTFFRDENFTGYRFLKMFIYGGEGIPEGDTSAVELFFRFGADSSNYYEQRRPIYKGWDERNWLKIDLDEVTRLKLALQSAADTTSRAIRDTTIGSLRVHGDPSLSRIKFMSIGLVNRSGRTIEEGEVWVDELRLDGVRRPIGTAARIAANIGLADLLKIQGEYWGKANGFRDLNTKDVPWTEENYLNFTGDLRFDKLFPKSWGISLPSSFSWNRVEQLPRLKPGSDVVLTPEDRRQERTFREKKSARISFNKRPSKNLLLGLTLDRINGFFSFSKQFRTMPTRHYDKEVSYNGSLSYNYTSPRKKSIRIFGWLPDFMSKSITEAKFRYLPSKISISITGNKRSKIYRIRRDGEVNRDTVFTLGENYSVSLKPFDPLSTNYSMSINRDLKDGVNLNFDNFKLGKEIGRSQNLSFSFSPKLLKWLSQSYSYSANYSENNDPKLSYVRGEYVGRSVSGSSNMSVSLVVSIPALLRPFKRDSSSAFFPLGKLSDRLGALNGSYSRRGDSRISGLAGRPSLSYQFGFSRVPDVEKVSAGKTYGRDSRSMTDTYDLSTGMNLPYNIDLKVRCTYSYTAKVMAGNSVDTRDLTLPNVSLRWGGFKRIIPFRDMIKSSSVSFTYNRSIMEKGTKDFEQRLSKNVTDKFSPLLSWNASWKNGMNTTFDISKTESEVTDYFKEGGISGKTRSGNTSVNARISYIFSSQRGLSVPFWRRFNLSSNLNFSLDFRYSNSYRKFKRGASWIGKTKQSEWSLSPRASYRFSRRFSGEAHVEIRNIKDKLRGTTRKVREVGITGEIRFD